MTHPTSPSAAGGPRGSLLPVLGLALSAFLLNTSEFVPIGLLTDIARAFELGEAQAGAMVSVYAWAVALLSLPLMLLACRVPPRRLVVGVLAVFCAGQVATALAPSFPLLVAARVLVACAHAVFWSVATPFAVRTVSPRRATLAMGLVATGTSVAMIAGMPLGRALGLALGWRMAFASVAAAAVVALAGLLACFPRLPLGEPFTLARLPELAASRRLVGVYLVTILLASGYYTGYSYIEPFLAQVAGLSAQAVTGTLAVFGAAGLAGSWLFSRLYEGRRTAFLRLALAGVTASLLLLAPTAGAAGGPLAVCALWGMSATAFNVAAQAEVIRASPQGASAVAMSIFSGLFNVGIGTGSLLGAAVCEAAGVGSVGLVGGALAAGATLLCAARVPGRRADG